MDNQNQQPNQMPPEPQFSSSPTPSVDMPKPESPQTRWFIIAVLLLAALGLGVWIWSNYAPASSPLNIPPPINNQLLITDTNIDKNIEPPLISSSTPLDTSTWKTYRNEEYGFEFKYPSSFIIENDKTWAQFVDGPAYSLSLSDQSVIEQPRIGFRIRTDGHDTPYEILYNILVSDSGSINVISEDREFYKKSLGGPGFFDDQSSIKATTVFKGVRYEWTFYYKKGGFDYESIFRLILSTFKFIE